MQVSPLDDHPALTILPNAPTEDQIVAFGRVLLDLEDPDNLVDISTRHHHATGIYGRSVVVKKGTFLVGLPHKLDGLALSIGDITVWTAEGGRKRFTGAHLMETQVGGMRVGFAHQDTTWLTIHQNATGSDDLKTIEDSIVENAHLLVTRRHAQELLS